MAIVFVLGIILMIAAPLLRQAAIESNRRQYLYVLICQLPVLILALISLKQFKWAFWLGWSINLLFALYVAAIVVWLEFFWHW